jgi:histidinol-phosphatase (PHP family)
MIVRHRGKLGLSDDSHGKHAVGLNYNKLADYLQASGVVEIFHLARRQRGTGVETVAVADDWRCDPFWD